MSVKDIVNKLFPEDTKRRQVVRVIARTIKSINLTNIKKLIKIIRLYGFKHAFEKAKFLLTRNFNKNDKPEYSAWIDLNEPTQKELDAQKKHKFKYKPKISIIVPMYNTPINFFEELVDSLIRQTYSNWELCLADRKS